MINAVAGCIPQQHLREVSAPEHTQAKLIIGQSSVRSTGEALCCVPPAQPLPPCSRRNNRDYAKARKSQLLFIRSLHCSCCPAQRQPGTDLAALVYTLACLWAAHTQGTFHPSLPRCTSSFGPAVPWMRLHNPSNH